MTKTKKSLLGFVGWTVGIIVTLAVAFGLISGTLAIPFMPNLALVIAGWIVVVATIIGIITAIFK